MSPTVRAILWWMVSKRLSRWSCLELERRYCTRMSLGPILENVYPRPKLRTVFLPKFRHRWSPLSTSWASEYVDTTGRRRTWLPTSLLAVQSSRFAVCVCLYENDLWSRYLACLFTLDLSRSSSMSRSCVKVHDQSQGKIRKRRNIFGNACTSRGEQRLYQLKSGPDYETVIEQQRQLFLCLSSSLRKVIGATSGEGFIWPSLLSH